MNIRSVEKQEDGSYISLSREVSLYRDLDTGLGFRIGIDDS